MSSDTLERIINESNVWKDIINKALDVVHKYISKHKRILVGGMAIDFALKAKESRLYEEGVLPDYDFISPEFHKDAYNIATILHESGLPNVECINAMHASTMVVRTNFIGVADITYIPQSVYDKIPYITYKGIRIVHPHYQMIDQHVVLAMPYRGSPWESVNRWGKDMIRYSLLNEFYPIKPIQVNKFKDISYSVNDLRNECIGGFVGLELLIGIAEKQGYDKKSTITVDNFIKGKIPINSSVVVYSDDLWDLEKKFLGKKIWRNSFLEKLPRSVRVGDLEIYDNCGTQIGAHYSKDLGLWIANPQVLCLYFMTSYIICKMAKISTDEALMGYSRCQDLIIWATKSYKERLIFLPTPITYGAYNVSELYINNIKKMAMHLGKMERVVSQPKAAYFRDLDGIIPPGQYDFDPTSSHILQFDGAVVPPFNPEPLIKAKKGLMS